MELFQLYFSWPWPPGPPTSATASSRKKHHTGRALTSDWFINSFIIAVYQEFFLKFSQDIPSKARLKEIFS